MNKEVSVFDAAVGGAPAPDVLHIAFGVDSGYFRGMGVAITSIVKQNPDKAFVFHVFAFTVSDDNRRRIAKLGSMFALDVRIHKLSEHMLDAFRQFPCFAQNPLGMFIRLLIPDVLHGVTNRVLYLDADLLCFGRLDAITEVDIDDVIAAVVHDEQSTTAKTQIAALDLAYPQYFNSGVMYINVDKWHDNNIQNVTLTALSSREFVFADQDALNIALNGQVKFIGDEWNCRYHLVDYISRGDTHLALPAGTVFMHFTGPAKPWHDWCLHEAKSIFAALQAQSSWSDMPLDPPRSAREMKLFSKSLIKHKRMAEGIGWHLKYIYQRTMQRRSSR